MAITSWTSEGMNWNSPDLNKPEYVEALRLALLERMKISGSMPGGDLLKSPWECKDFKGLARKSSYLSSIHAAVLNIYGRFYDYSASGNMEEWTFENLLNAAGVDDFFQPLAGVMNNNAWGLNMYKIINQLCWTKTSDLLVENQRKSGGAFFDYGYYDKPGTIAEQWENDFISELYSNWSNQSWESSANLNPVALLRIYGIHDWYAVATRCCGTVTPEMSSSIRDFSGNVDVALYGKTTVHDDYDLFGNSIDTYDQEAAGGPQGTYVLIESKTVDPQNTPDPWFNVVAQDDSLPYSDLIDGPPPAGDNYKFSIVDEIWKYWGYTDFIMITKYNFSFQT